MERFSGIGHFLFIKDSSTQKTGLSGNIAESSGSSLICKRAIRAQSDYHHPLSRSLMEDGLPPPQTHRCHVQASHSVVSDQTHGKQQENVWYAAGLKTVRQTSLSVPLVRKLQHSLPGYRLAALTEWSTLRGQSEASRSNLPVTGSKWPHTASALHIGSRLSSPLDVEGAGKHDDPALMVDAGTDRNMYQQFKVVLLTKTRDRCRMVAGGGGGRRQSKGGNTGGSKSSSPTPWTCGVAS